MGEFVGGRIVPKHCGTWNKRSKYEMLSIVYQPETGDSYISRRSVPAGTALSSEEYWAICSEYSAQVRNLEQDVDADVQQMHSDVNATKAAMSKELSETHTAMSNELSETHEAISQELSATEQRISKKLQETTTTLTGQVTTARNDLVAGRKDLETTKNQLTARMNSIVGGNTTDTELLDARVDADGKTYANLSERLKAVDAYYAGADAETVDGTAHGSLAKYIHEEWRYDYDLIRGGTFYKGHVDVSGLNTSDDMSGRVDPNGEGYYLLIPTGNLHDAKLNVLFYGLRGKPAIMRGNWGGMEGDFHYAGRLSIVPAQHFREMDDGAIMMLTSISAWNRSSAKYLYINLTEEEAAKAQVGYDRDEDGDLIVNEDEAETVKAIYYLYLNGVSFSDIAELLKAYKRKTKQGSYEWSASTLAEIVANERHCGDIRAWKTFTPNFLTHKAKKNNGERTQFRRKNHHEAIVSRTVYEAANFLRASRAYAKKARPLPVLSVVDNGILRGYVPLDKDWTGFSTDEYQKASESVMSELEDTRQIEYKAGLDMSGYEVVRSQYFSTTQNPAMTIADGKLCFNTACLKKFENVEYVELLLNSVNRCIAVRPCDGNNPNAIHWGKLREGRWCALSKSCRGLAKTLFDIMDWDQDLKYRFRGDFIENDDQKVMLFQLDEPEMVKTENIVLPPKEAETDDRAEIAGRTVKQIINILPPEWEDTFGRPITSIGEINLLEQRHYAADWDVLRPAKELAEYSTLTSEDLEELLHEAEKIIEGWPIPDEHGAGESADNGDGESAGVGTECGADVGAGTEENGDRADL